MAHNQRRAIATLENAYASLTASWSRRIETCRSPRQANRTDRSSLNPSTIDPMASSRGSSCDDTSTHSTTRRMTTADRVSASITIGGKLPTMMIEQLFDAINEEGLSLEYDGGPVTADEYASGEHLQLYVNEVAWGSFDTLEAFCRQHGL